MLVTTNHQANLARDVLSESMPVKLTIDATNAITMSATIATEKVSTYYDFKHQYYS